MTIDMKKYNELKKEAETLKTEISRAEGVLEQKMAELKEKHGCETFAEGEEKLQGMAAELTQLEETYNTKLGEYEAKWKDSFDESEKD